MIKHPKAIGPLVFNATIGRLCGPAGGVTLPTYLKVIAQLFWGNGEGVAFPFDTVKKTLWPEGYACPADPEQAFRSDLRELRVITRLLAHGSDRVLDFRQNKAGDWLVKVRTLR